MLTVLLILAAAPAEKAMCLRPAAPDAASARRLALIMIGNRNRTGRPLPAYDLRIERDPDDAGQWIAYQTPREGPTRGGGGMSFRIDRCSGVISRIAYAR
jgi:hypothetical protein